MHAVLDFNAYFFFNLSASDTLSALFDGTDEAVVLEIWLEGGGNDGTIMKPSSTVDVGNNSKQSVAKTNGDNNCTRTQLLVAEISANNNA